jgi:integrase
MKPPRIIPRPNGKTPGSPLKWMLTWSITGANGRAQRRENWFPNQREAEDALRKVKAQVAAHGAKHAGTTPEEQAALVRFREWTARTPNALSLVAIVEAAITAHANATESLTVAEAIRLRLDSVEKRGLSERHKSDLRLRLGKFEAAFSTRNIASITTAEIDSWLHKLGVGPVAWMNYARSINSIFTAASKRMTLPRNPVKQLEKPKAATKAPAILTPSQCRILLSSAPPEIIPILVLQAFCGVRLAEAQRIKWENIRMDGKNPYVELPSSVTKTNRRRNPPIPKNALAWLRPLRGLPKTSIEVTHDKYHSALQAAAAAAGVDWKPNILRHSFGTYRLGVVKNAAQVAEEMGNSAAVVRSHYQNVTSPEAARQWFEVGLEAKPKAGRIVRILSA